MFQVEGAGSLHEVMVLESVLRKRSPHLFGHLSLLALAAALGGALYAGATVPRDGNTTPSWVVALLLVAVTIATPFLPPPADPLSGVVQMLAAYLVLAIAAEWMDRSRAAG